MLPLSDISRDIIPPCAGKWYLFDSVNPVHHEEAAALCAQCPMVRECGDLLTAARVISQAGGRPAGTWAGNLIGGNIEARDARTAAENARFTPEEAIAAHRRYQKGERDEITRAGERVYERKRKKARRARAREQAACGVPAAMGVKQLHIDHVIPVALGGTNDPWNLVSACWDCNAGKTNGVPTDELIRAVRGDYCAYYESTAGDVIPCRFCSMPVQNDPEDDPAQHCTLCDMIMFYGYDAGSGHPREWKGFP